MFCRGGNSEYYDLLLRDAELLLVELWKPYVQHY